MDIDYRAIGKANKARGAQYERDAAQRWGTTRYPADSGGPADLVPLPGYAIQVKSGVGLVNKTIREAVDAARSVANSGQLGVAVVVSRHPGRLRRFVVIDEDEFLAWEGISK